MRRNAQTDFGVPQHNAAGSNADYSLRSVVEDVQGVFDVLWSGRYWIMVVAAAFLLPVIVFLLVTPSQYKATAQIMLDPRQIKLVEGAVVQGGLGESSVGADTLLVDSQTEIIYSRTILDRVVAEQKLFTDKEFYKPRGLGLRMQLRNIVGAFVPGFEPERLPAPDPDAVALDRFRDKHLKVKRVGNTYVIDITVLSTDPEKAARLANAVAGSYISDQVAFLSETTHRATTDLESRIKELRKRLRAAEDGVEAYRKKSGLLGGPGLLITEQQLQDLNAKLSAARADAALAKARYERLREDTAETIAAGNTSEALESKVIVNLRTSLARAQSRLSGLQGQLGTAHPTLKRARDERQGFLRLIEQELVRIRAVAKNEYELARANEKSLEQELVTARSRVAESKSSLVRLRELEREAQAAKVVLESFLVRAKETSEQESLTRPTSRVIAAAAVPQRPSFPPTKLLGAAALFLGLFAGALLVWLRHILSAPKTAYGIVGNYAAIEDLRGRQSEQEAPSSDNTILSPDVIAAFQARLDRLQRSS